MSAAIAVTVFREKEVNEVHVDAGTWLIETMGILERERDVIAIIACMNLGGPRLDGGAHWTWYAWKSREVGLV